MIVLFDFRGINPPSSRHAKMEDKRIASVGADQAVFGTAAELDDPSARQALAQVDWKRAAQVGSPGLNARYPMSFKHTLKAADGRLDFG